MKKKIRSSKSRAIQDSKRCTPWRRSRLPISGRQIHERTCGQRRATVVHGDHWWTINVYGPLPHSVDRSSTLTLKAAKTKATRMAIHGAAGRR